MHVARDRAVLTWEPNGLPEGVLTGYVKDRVFYLEHIVALPGSKPWTVLRMLRAALKIAPEYDIKAVTLHLVPNHPQAAGLEYLAERFNFQMYHQTEEAKHYVLFLGGV